MDNISFSSYLRDRFNNHNNLLCYPFRTEPPQRLSIPTSQTTNNPQDPFRAAFRPPPKPQAISNPIGWRPLVYSSLNMTGEAQGYFKDHVRAPDEVYLSTGLSTTPPYFRHDGLPYESSWSTGNSNYTYSSAAPQMPMKITNSPALSVPSVLPREVDASKYERLGYREWYMGRPEYDSSSPSSSGYYSSSPATPNDAYPDNFYDAAPSLNSFACNDASNTRFRLQSTTGLPYSTTILPTSNPYQPTYALNTDSLAANDPVGNQIYGHPGYTQFQHHRMIEPSLSPPGLKVPTPSESGTDDADDTTYSTSSPQTHDYAMIAGDDISRERQDELLVQMRKEDYSYRQIKSLCGFKEAESTLRGRHRALTKDREERVRKPKWKPHDVTLLRRSMRHYNKDSKAKMRCGRRKLPWKKISQRMKDHGSSYLFAPATCAKKWESLENQMGLN